MSKSSQSGFAAVELLLTLILVAIVAFTGYYVWHSQRQTDKTLKTTNDTAQTTAPKKSTTAATQKYLTISEWGVKLPLTNDLSGAYYVYNADSKAVYLSLNTYKGTNCAADAVSLGAISRFDSNDTDSETGKFMISEQPNATQVGSYYYDYEHPQAACDGRTTNATAGFDDAGVTKSSNLMNEFKDAATHLVAS